MGATGRRARQAIVRSGAGRVNPPGTFAPVRGDGNCEGGERFTTEETESTEEETEGEREENEEAAAEDAEEEESNSDDARD